MKKSMLISALALAALATTSCSNEETKAIEPQSNAIEFGTYLGRDAISRGTVVNDAAIQASGFGVTAFYTSQTAWSLFTKNIAPNFMYNQKVSYSAPAWTYSPVKYWPKMKGDMISFFAYAPYVSDSSTGITLPAKDATTEQTTIGFEVQACDKMVDFVAAQVIDAKQKNAAEGGASAISFELKHELSRLAFKVKTSMDLASETHVVVKDMEFVSSKTFYNKGNYTFNNATTSTEVTTRGTWSDQERASSAYSINDVINYSSTLNFGGKTYTQGFEVTSATAKDLFKTNQYLFVIPESDNNTGTGLAANTVAVQIKYDIVTVDEGLENGYSCTEAIKTVYLPTGILKQGVAYNVTFTINMDEIEVSASVTDWETPSTSDVVVPFTPDSSI